MPSVLSVCFLVSSKLVSHLLDYVMLDLFPVWGAVPAPKLDYRALLQGQPHPFRFRSSGLSPKSVTLEDSYASSVFWGN